MEKEEPEDAGRSRFRHLPPRVTPEQMVETQPLVRAPDEPGWTADEREIQGGRAG
jgi:hypothetical protein